MLERLLGEKQTFDVGFFLKKNTRTPDGPFHNF